MKRRYVLQHKEKGIYFRGFDDSLNDETFFHDVGFDDLTPNYSCANEYTAHDIKRFFGDSKMRKTFRVVSLNGLKRNSESLLNKAIQAINESWNIPDYCSPTDETMESGYSFLETWCKVFATHRDSDLLDQSNYSAYIKLLDDFIMEHNPKGEIIDDYQYQEGSASHWLVGYTNEILIPALTSKGKVTEIFKHCLGIQDSLDDYPVLDEDDFSGREHESQLEYIENNLIPGYLKDTRPDDIASEIFTALWDNNIHFEMDCGGAYLYDPNENASEIIMEYCARKGYIDETELEYDDPDLYERYLEVKIEIHKEYIDQFQYRFAFYLT